MYSVRTPVGSKITVRRKLRTSSVQQQERKQLSETDQGDHKSILDAVKHEMGILEKLTASGKTEEHQSLSIVQHPDENLCYCAKITAS